MAVYVGIRKLEEDSASATYAFGLRDPFDGRLRISKETGEVEVIREDPLSVRSARYAARKVFVHWRDGELPDATCWAS